MVGAAFKESILKFFFIDDSCWSSVPMVLCTGQLETIHHETQNSRLLDWDLNMYCVNFRCSHAEGIEGFWQQLTMNFGSVTSRLRSVQR